MRNTLNKLHWGLGLIAASVAFSGCGSLSLSGKAKLTVGMLGLFSSPPGATGNNIPKVETFKLTAATLTTDDGSSVSIYTADPLSVAIINRPQILFDYDLGDLIGKSVASISVVFDPQVTASGKYAAAMTATLGVPSAFYGAAFTVQKAKELRFDVGVLWQDTVTRDDDAKTETLQAPTLQLAPGDSAN